MATERPGPSWLLTGGFLAAAVVVGAGLGALEVNGVASPLDRVENLTLDWRFLLAGARPAPPGVVIVAIDDETLSEAGGARPSREMTARIVRALAGFHPRSIAVDIAFLNSKGEEADTELAGALKAAPASSRRSAFSTRPIVPERGAEPSDLGARAEAVLRSLADRGDPRRGASGARQHLDRLERSPPLCSDDLSNARRRGSIVRAGRRRPRGWRLSPILASRPDRASQASREQMDLGYHMPLRFYGPAGSFKRISAARAPSRRPRSGGGARQSRRRRGHGDRRGATRSRRRSIVSRPGAEVFATAIGNLVAGDGLARTPSTRRIDAAAAVALPIVMIALMAMRRAAMGLTLASLVFVLWLAAVFLAFSPRLLAQRRGAARVGPAADCRLRRGPVHCRASCRDENCSREVDAGQVSLAAPS